MSELADASGKSGGALLYWDPVQRAMNFEFIFLAGGFSAKRVI